MHVEEMQSDAQGQEVERAALRMAETSMMVVETNFSEWFCLYEETMVDMAPREEVVELLRTAPDDFTRGLIYGKYLMRLEIAAMTRRPFV